MKNKTIEKMKRSDWLKELNAWLDEFPADFIDMSERLVNIDYDNEQELSDLLTELTTLNSNMIEFVYLLGKKPCNKRSGDEG